MKTSRLAHWAIQSGASYRRAHKVASCPGLSHLLMRVVSAFCLITFTLSGAASAWTVAWKSSPETGVAGYRLTYGTQSGNPSDTIDTGMALSTSINGLESGETYYFTVKVLNGDGVQSDPSPELAFTVPVDPNGEPTEIPNNGWSLHFVDSQDTDGYAATQAFDGNPSTFWHTIWKTETTPPPHDLQINLGATYPVTGFRYLPRQDSYTDGNISEYEFYVSEDGTNWGQPVASGTFSATKTEKEILFPQTYARYVRLLSYSDVYGDDATNVAELTVLQGDSGITPPGNSAPVANAGSTNVVEDGQVSITLAANDPENDTLTYTIVSGPSHGTFSGTAPNLSYTPAGGYSGSDSFTFKVNDGEFDSNVATFTIAVTAVNHAPVAVAKSASTAEDSAVSVVLSASDSDGDSLNYSIVSGPSHGALSGNAPNMSYMPASNYNGADSFTYRANDGSLNSNVATFNILVSSVNDAPVASSGSASTSEDSTVSIALSASDREGTALTYTIVNAPAHGTLSGTAPNLSYRPSAGYNGSDSFRFRVNDGDLNSNTATISISISEVNNAPVAASGSASTVEDTAVSINLSASDAEEDVLIYTILSGPAHGSLSGNAPNLTYAPDSDYNGSDSFTFRVNDGSLNSNVATTSISISPKNDAPVATSKAAATSEGDSVAISLSASDKDGDSLTYVVVSGPAHGTLSGSAPNLSYTPANGFNGSDSFTFRANDGTVNSNTATVSISISETNDAPVAAAKSVATQEDKAVSIALSASDPDGDSLNYSIVSGPAHGTLSGNAPNLSYLPASNFNGSDSFTFRVNDGALNSNVATVSISVSAVNDAPVAAAASTSTAEETVVSITLSASDPEGDSLSYSIVSGPAHGTLSGSGPNLSYTPANGFNGSDSFTFRANDGSLNSNVATVGISVSAVNDAPIAASKSVVTQEDSAVSIILAASDPEGSKLSYIIASAPGHGTLSGTAPNLSYIPNKDFNGSDSFTFRANDGVKNSNLATVAITIGAVNDAPVAASASAEVIADESVSIELTAIDKDGDSLTYTVVSSPSHGTLSGNAPNLSYTPVDDFSGQDSFTFKVSDGTVESNVATVSITVSAAANNSEVISQDGWTLHSVDSASSRSNVATSAFDGDPTSRWHTLQSWFSSSLPHEIQINLGQEYSIRGFRYLPRQDGSTEGNIGEYEFYVSTDGSNWGSPVATGTFTETAEEREVTWNVPAAARYVCLRALTDASGGRHSNVAELNLIGDAVTNHAPKAISDSLTTSKDVTLAMSLGSSDQDGDPLTYSIVSGPSHGNLSGTAPNLKYTPTSGFTGEDSFTYQVHDGSVNSNVATIAISVTAAANTAPVASSESADTEEGRSVTIMLNASDADRNSLTYSIVSQPAHGTLSGTAPKLTYRPSSKYSGSDSFTFRANDGSVDSNVATISIEVKPKRTWRTNRTPRFFSTWFKRPAGTETESYSATAIAAEVEDPDEGDAIVISKVAGPSWLKVSPSGALSGVPPASAVGVNRFKVRATDLAGAAAESEMVITVLPADLPLPWNMKMLGGGQMTERVSYRSSAFHIESSGRLGKSKDAGSYIYRSLSGDGEITARVKAFDSANGNSRAGVMIRKSLAANSKFAFIGVNGKGRYRWMGRSATGKKSFGKSRSAGNIPNVWVRLIRKGNTITAYTKGKNSKWKKVGSTKIKLGKNCYIGLLSSGEKGKDNAAVFNRVKVKR